jgi:hypothetical protein
MRKLTYYPESLEVCKELIAHYESSDLDKIVEALNIGIIQANQDMIYKGKNEFEQLLTELWNDKSIHKRITGLKYGIPVSIAAIGTTALGVLAGFEGFLAGLGIAVGAKILDSSRKSLSEKIARFSAENYQATIYDFKKKYHLESH